MHGHVVALSDRDEGLGSSHGRGGPAIVLCHGNSSSHRTFEQQLRGELGRRFRLVAIDLPGHGESARARDPRLRCPRSRTFS